MWNFKSSEEFSLYLRSPVMSVALLLQPDLLSMGKNGKLGPNIDLKEIGQIRKKLERNRTNRKKSDNGFRN